MAGVAGSARAGHAASGAAPVAARSGGSPQAGPRQSAAGAIGREGPGSGGSGASVVAWVFFSSGGAVAGVLWAVAGRTGAPVPGPGPG